ncbi:hypothetical protein [Hafnia paralvei]|uniref:hypothetical protein n=1 Tax=Hafnia paralvei TaxID=546367 RepID=UPI003C2B8AE7
MDIDHSIAPSFGQNTRHTSRHLCTVLAAGNLNHFRYKNAVEGKERSSSRVNAMFKVSAFSGALSRAKKNRLGNHYSTPVIG